MKWILLMTNDGHAKPPVEMNFPSPYQAREWFRQLSYTYQAVGASTKIVGTAGEPILEIYGNGNLPVTIFSLSESE